jgi:hypothetical protein
VFEDTGTGMYGYRSPLYFHDQENELNRYHRCPACGLNLHRNAKIGEPGGSPS